MQFYNEGEATTLSAEHIHVLGVYNCRKGIFTGTDIANPSEEKTWFKLRIGAQEYAYDMDFIHHIYNNHIAGAGEAKINSFGRYFTIEDKKIIDKKIAEWASP